MELDAGKAGVAVTLIQPTLDYALPPAGVQLPGARAQAARSQIDPDDVARAILEAASSGPHEVKVGGMSKLNTAIAKLMPSLGDWMARRQIDRQHDDEPPRHPEGTLHAPGEAGHCMGRCRPGRDRSG